MCLRGRAYGSHSAPQTLRTSRGARYLPRGCIPCRCCSCLAGCSWSESLCPGSPPISYLLCDSSIGWIGGPRALLPSVSPLLRRPFASLSQRINPSRGSRANPCKRRTSTSRLLGAISVEPVAVTCQNNPHAHPPTDVAACTLQPLLSSPNKVPTPQTHCDAVTPQLHASRPRARWRGLLGSVTAGHEKNNQN